jgi:hypothetical protein
VLIHVPVAQQLCHITTLATSSLPVHSISILHVVTVTMSLTSRLAASSWQCLRCTIGGGRLYGSSQPLAHRDSDCPSNCHGGMCEYRTGGECAHAREQHEAADRDEHGRDVGHHLGMLGDEGLQDIALSERRVFYCTIASLVSSWTRTRMK